MTTPSKAIAALYLLENCNVEGKYFLTSWLDGGAEQTQARMRLFAIEKLWNDKRLTDLLDQFIEADKGGVS